MKIKTIPNKILRSQAQDVKFPLSEETKKIIKEMIEHIDASQEESSAIRSGIGIAAPQIGYSLRMFYVNVPGESGIREFLINPEIIAASETEAALKDGEGCLSVEDTGNKYEGLVHRKLRVIIKGYSFLQNKEVKIDAVGFNAIVLQHEYDHLRGSLFFDRIDKKKPWENRNDEVLI